MGAVLRLSEWSLCGQARIEAGVTGVVLGGGASTGGAPALLQSAAAASSLSLKRCHSAGLWSQCRSMVQVHVHGVRCGSRVQK